MHILHFRAASAVTALALASLLAACNHAADKPAATATPTVTPVATTAPTAPAGGSTITPAQLMASHQQLVTDYQAMASADSVMKADHQHVLAAAQAAGIYNTPTFQELKQHHEALMAQLQQAIARRQAIMDRQIAMAANQTSGKMTAAQLAQENTAITADDQHIRQEHKQLVAEHAALMAQSQALLQKAGRA